MGGGGEREREDSDVNEHDCSRIYEQHTEDISDCFNTGRLF